MSSDLVTGAASAEQQAEALEVWYLAAKRNGIDVSRFPLDGKADERLRWAKQMKLEIATCLSRFSSQLQHSTSAQIRECAEAAARLGMYLPPELICVDEAVSGRKTRREGLDRAKGILARREATVILVYKVSRLFRVGYKGFQFVQEEVVDEGLRAISVSQGIDTADQKTWKTLLYVHGLTDEMLLGTIADHVRSGLKSLFLLGYVIGALTVGYFRKEIPGGRPTNTGRPRTMPAIDEEAATHIRQAFEDIRAGMPIRRAWRKYVAAGGKGDPRAQGRRMSPIAFRRMLANRRYTGLWAFGRMRNSWLNRRDSTQQIVQPDQEVAFFRSEELRIIDDELFEAVQAGLAMLRRGPRGPKRKKAVKLMDLVTELFFCARCGSRFYQAGANGLAMRCKNSETCGAIGVLPRQTATTAVLIKLAELIRQNSSLVEDVVARSQELDGGDEEKLQQDIDAVGRKIASCNRRIADLSEMLGSEDEEDNDTFKASIRETQSKRASLLSEKAQLERYLATRNSLRPGDVRARLEQIGSLLQAAAEGELGEEGAYQAFTVLRILTGDKIVVAFEGRAGKKRTTARGEFHLQLFKAIDLPVAADSSALGPDNFVELWLRPPPRRDLLAEEVYQLIEVDGLSFEQAAQKLRDSGQKINFANVWTTYRRYFELHGLRIPKRPYNNGQPRKSRSA
jgi:site-specific DNA recombinase